MPVRKAHRHAIRLLSLAQSKMNDQFAGRLVASRRSNFIYLFTAGGLDRNSRTHGSSNAEETAAIRAAVFEEMRPAVKIHHQNIEVAILVKVSLGGAAVGPQFT